MTTRNALERRTALFGWVFAAPAIALLAVFFVYPLGASLYQSFTTTDRGITSWVGLENYSRLLSDQLIGKSLTNAFLILLVQVPLMMVLATGLAVILNSSWLKFRTGFRLIHFLPAVTTLVAYALVFRVMLQTQAGFVNQMLAAVGISPVDWLNNPTAARIALIASITWRWTGYNMVFVLAGLQGIPKELYESAETDGASGWQTFWAIVVPQLRPVLLFIAITSTIGSLQLFDENYILTGGGPSYATLTPVLLLYKVGFQQFNFGYASAIAWLIVLITAVLSLVQFKFLRSES